MAEQTSSARAEARTARVAPRKTHLVVDPVRGKSATEALVVLQSMSRAASPIVEKVPKSAIASVKHNYSFGSANLHASEAYANEDVTLRRSHPHVEGMASLIDKRTSHVVIVVSGKNG